MNISLDKVYILLGGKFLCKICNNYDHFDTDVDLVKFPNICNTSDSHREVSRTKKLTGVLFGLTCTTCEMNYYSCSRQYV